MAYVPTVIDRAVYATVTDHDGANLTAYLEGSAYSFPASTNPGLGVGDQVPSAFLLPGSSRIPILISPPATLREFPPNYPGFFTSSYTISGVLEAYPTSSTLYPDGWRPITASVVYLYISAGQLTPWPSAPPYPIAAAPGIIYSASQTVPTPSGTIWPFSFSWDGTNRNTGLPAVGSYVPTVFADSVASTNAPSFSGANGYATNFVFETSVTSPSSPIGWPDTSSVIL